MTASFERLVATATEELCEDTLDTQRYRDITTPGSYWVGETLNGRMLHSGGCAHAHEGAFLQHATPLEMFQRYGDSELWAESCTFHGVAAFQAWYHSAPNRPSCQELREELDVLAQALAALRAGAIPEHLASLLRVLRSRASWNPPTWRVLAQEASTLLTHLLRSCDLAAISRTAADPFSTDSLVGAARGYPQSTSTSTIPYVAFLDATTYAGVLLTHWAGHVQTHQGLGVLICSQREMELIEENLAGCYTLRGDQPVIEIEGDTSWLQDAGTLQLVLEQLAEDSSLVRDPDRVGVHLRYLDRDVLTAALSTARSALTLV